MSLTITVGCPGAGKSTWAEENLPPTTLRLERDRFRECMFGSRRAYHEHVYLRSERSAVVTQAMMAAMIYWPSPVWAVTDTGIDFPAVAPFVYHARRVAVPIKLVIFERDLDLLVWRNETRDAAHRVPHELLEDRHSDMMSPDAWWRDPQWTKEFA